MLAMVYVFFNVTKKTGVCSNEILGLQAISLSFCINVTVRGLFWLRSWLCDVNVLLYEPKDAFLKDQPIQSNKLKMFLNRN